MADPPAAHIADVPSTPAHLRGTPLGGKPILEVPVQMSPIPADVIDIAEGFGISIRDYEGKWLLQVD